MKKDEHSEEAFIVVADYGAGHRESRLVAGEDPEMFMESASGERVALAAEDVHQGVSYQPGTAACGFDCHVDPKYGFVPEADCPVHDPSPFDVSETITTVAGMQLRAASLFSEMIQDKIAGYRVEMDRGVHPAEFHITTWR